MPTLQSPDSPVDVSATFARLRDRWAQDTLLSSDIVQTITHPAYYSIIGLGREALPYIFEDLQNGGGPWFVALQAITREDLLTPENANDARKLRDAWLQWGIAHGYLRP